MIASALDMTIRTPALDLVMRVALRTDLPVIAPLQQQSIVALGSGFYDETQIEAFLRYMPMMEEYLIDDGTYFVAERAGRIVGCGGWSSRPPGYGETAPRTQSRGASPAKVRAMYVHPSVARHGIGRALLHGIEQAIVQAGYDAAHLDATLPGVPLYRNCGYRATADTHVEFPNGVRLPVVCMHKRLRGGARGQY